MPKLTKPTTLKGLYKELEPLYSPWREKVKRARDTYYRKFHNQIQLPQGVPVHEASTARNLVDNLADQIRTDSPRISFDARGTSKKALDHKELMELVGQHLMDGIVREAVIDPFGQAVHDEIRDSAACIKFLVDTYKLPQEPPTDATEKELREWRVMRADTWAFDVRAVDPLQVFIAPGRKQPPAFVLEYQQRLEAEVALDYPEVYKTREERGFKRSAINLVDWFEYWDADHFMVEVDGQLIEDKENPYGFVPYAWEYNGLGRHDWTGQLSFLGEPILEAVMGELEEEVRVKTAMSAQWQFHVFPRLVTTLSAVKARQMFLKGPGAIITIAEMAQMPKWLETTPPNQQMVAFLQEIKASIAARFPPGLNQREPGVEAALHQALLQGQATKPLQPIKNALNRLATRVINGMARQAKVMYLDMTVFGKLGKAEKSRMVSADDFTDFNFHVKFEATDPAEDDRKLLTGSAMLRIPGLLSNETFYDKFGAALGINWEEEQVRIMKETIIKQFVESGMMVETLIQEMQAQEQTQAEQGMLGTATAQAAEALAGATGGLGAGPGTPGQGSRTMEGITGVQPPQGVTQGAKTQVSEGTAQ